jgi:hypothetical protein
MLKWENIPHDNGFHLRRAKTFGGWLIAAISDVNTVISESSGFYNNEQGHEFRTAITFVPDPNHEWELEQ